LEVIRHTREANHDMRGNIRTYLMYMRTWMCWETFVLCLCKNCGSKTDFPSGMIKYILSYFNSEHIWG